jgi:hypothetical protein
LGFKIAVDDSTGVAIVESVTELVKEQLDLIGGHGGFVLTHVLLEVIIDQLEDQIELLFGRDVEHLAEAEWGIDY